MLDVRDFVNGAGSISIQVLRQKGYPPIENRFQVDVLLLRSKLQYQRSLLYIRQNRRLQLDRDLGHPIRRLVPIQEARDLRMRGRR